MGLVAAVLAAPRAASAQNGFEVSPNAEPNIPVPLGNTRMEGGGFYTFYEGVLFQQPRSLGSQSVAFRGLFDQTGNVGAALGAGRVPGRFIGVNGTGSRNPVEALNTDDLGRSTYSPGFNIGAGYKFESGVAVYASYMHLFDAKYTASASAIPPGYQFGANLFGSFLSSGVVNHPFEYNGPTGLFDAGDTTLDRPAVVGQIAIPNAPVVIVQPGGAVIIVPVPPDLITVTNQTPGNTIGLWNAADLQSIQFVQRYDQVVLGSRIPINESDYSRTYGIAGGKMSWFWERFDWITYDYDVAGDRNSAWTGQYSNSLSQRMYGPYIGCGHDLYLGNSFGASFDLTGSLLLDVVKQRVKYERADGLLQSKRSQLDYNIVPNVDVNANLWWYPFEGCQLRVGYNAMSFFNTWRMDQPIGFDYGAPDPVYDRSYFRLLHGFNAGLSFSF